jgi:PhnB protein
VVGDAAVAAEWYVKAFGARERNRIPLPGGTVMAVELDFGTTTVHVGSEFAKPGIVSPIALGDTATVLQIETDERRRTLGSRSRRGCERASFH